MSIVPLMFMKFPGNPFYIGGLGSGGQDPDEGGVIALVAVAAIIVFILVLAIFGDK